MKNIYYVVVLIVRSYCGEYQLLMARRSEGIYMGGTWQLISGGIEPNETAWQAALREMREETDLIPVKFYRLSTHASFYRPENDSLNIAPMFCAIVKENAIVSINEEHSDFDWVNVKEAKSKLMWPSDRDALQELCTEIIENSLAKQYMQIPLDDTLDSVS